MIKPAKEIVICTQPPEETTEDGIALSIESSKDRPETGIVYAIGEGELPIKIEVGDKIIYRKYSESEVFVNSKKYNFLDFKDIVGVVTPEVQDANKSE